MVVPNAAIFLQSMVGIAWLYVLTLYFQEVLGHGPLPEHPEGNQRRRRAAFGYCEERQEQNAYSNEHKG